MAKDIIKCDLCGKEFEKEIRIINEAKRCGYRLFCSMKCHSKAKTKSEKKQCGQCGREINVRQSQIRKSKSGIFFCSISCSATYNTGKHRTNEEKLKISKALLGRGKDGCNSRRISFCSFCGNEFVHFSRRDRKFCSPACSQIFHCGHPPATKQEVLSEMLKYHNEYGCTPSSKCLKRRFVHAAVRFFGTWNKAVDKAGLKANRQWMVRGNIKCIDGHKADSISERMVDDWLFENGIQHECHKYYPDSKMTCDFYLPDQNVWVEYFGLYGEHRQYDEKVHKKRRLASDLGLKLLELLPKHLYPEETIGDVILL